MRGLRGRISAVMRDAQRPLKYVPLVFSSLVCACASTTQVLVTVQRPAQVNMSAYKRIAIGSFSGDYGPSFASNLKERLVGSGVFSVTDRSQLGQIFSELKLSQSDLADPKSRVKIGKLLSGAAIVTGSNIGVHFEENVSYRNKTCMATMPSLNGESVYSYPCTETVINCTARSVGTLDVIDVQTGQIITSRALRDGCGDETSSLNGMPACARSHAELNRCSIDSEFENFVRSITPTMERLVATFMKDGSLPTLEVGIRHAQMGDMNEAAKIFFSAARSAETDPDIKPAAIAKAYWDLGLALEFSSRYDQALRAFKKAYLLDPVWMYLREQGTVQRLKKNAEELKRQGLIN